LIGCALARARGLLSMPRRGLQPRSQMAAMRGWEEVGSGARSRGACAPEASSVSPHWHEGDGAPRGAQFISRRGVMRALRNALASPLPQPEFALANSGVAGSGNSKNWRCLLSRNAGAFRGRSAAPSRRFSGRASSPFPPTPDRACVPRASCEAVSAGSHARSVVTAGRSSGALRERGVRLPAPAEAPHPAPSTERLRKTPHQSRACPALDLKAPNSCKREFG
jgi:hypothetical protein